MNFRNLFPLFACYLVVSTIPTFAQSNDDKRLRDAIGITPKQPNVDIDRPGSDELDGYKLVVTSKPGGFEVRDSLGRLVRKFVDTNGDRKLDIWSYYRNGVEVYRDVDSNRDKQADSYRWLGTGGTKWGIDPDQNGDIDFWKTISPEEVVSEAFEAIKTGSRERFDRLLITPDEIKSLQLGDAMERDVLTKLKEARSGFSDLVRSQRSLDRSSKLVPNQMESPSMLVKGNYDAGKDVLVHNHVSVFFETKSIGQISLGSMVQVGPATWRLVELPEFVGRDKPISNGSLFLPMPGVDNSVAASSGGAGVELSKKEKALADLYEEFRKLEEALSKATKPVVIAQLEEQKAKVLEQYIDLTDDAKDKQNWIEHFAEAVSSAYQSERFPNGKRYLQDFISRQRKAGKAQGLDYVQLRVIGADYYRGSGGDRKARDAAREQFIEDLKKFQSEFKTSKWSAEALCQIGIDYEINEEPDKAIPFYRECAKRFSGSDSEFVKRSEGAMARLNSDGKVVQFTGRNVKGQKFSLPDRRLNGKVVVLHFWETDVDNGIDELERLNEKYEGDVVIVGCNIDRETDSFKKYMSKNSDYNWIQLHEPGGLAGSPMAHQFGIPSAPMLMVIDKDGKLVESDVAFGELERVLQRLLK